MVANECLTGAVDRRDGYKAPLSEWIDKERSGNLHLSLAAEVVPGEEERAWPGVWGDGIILWSNTRSRGEQPQTIGPGLGNKASRRVGWTLMLASRYFAEKRGQAWVGLEMPAHGGVPAESVLGRMPRRSDNSTALGAEERCDGRHREPGRRRWKNGRDTQYDRITIAGMPLPISTASVTARPRHSSAVHSSRRGHWRGGTNHAVLNP